MYRNHRTYLVLAICLFFYTVVSSHLCAANETVITKQKTYIFYTALGSPIKDILEARIKEVFRRLDLDVKLLISPSSQRALMLANEDGDGDAFRVPNIKEIAPENTANLVQVPESIIIVALTVYTKNLSFLVEGWHSLERYHNGARIGAKILEKNIPGERTFVPTTVQLVKMLDSDRIDTMVEWDLVAENVIRNLKVMGIHKLSPPIKVQPFHIYIHKKHQALIPEIVQVLKDMKEDGAFDKIKIDVLGKFNLN